MKKLLIALLLLSSCTDAVYPQGTRANARATVLGAASGVKAASQLCASIVAEGEHATDAASKANSIAFGLHCKSLLTPAIDGLVMAAEAVDAWDASSPAKVGCGMKAVTVGLKATTDIIFLSGHPVPPWLVDTVQIASQLTPWANALCDPQYPTNKVVSYVGSTY